MSIKQFVHIIPSNQPANGQVSYKGGKPILNFNIGAQERVLLGKSLRLNFNIEILDSSGDPITAADKICFEPTLGVMSIIEELTISSKGTNQTIEQIKHYNRFLSSYYKNMTNDQDLLTCNRNLLGMSSSYLGFNNMVTELSQNGKVKDCSIELPSGLFNGTKHIPLSSQWGLNGLLLQINLANDSNVLFNYDGSSVSGYSYVLNNVYISAVLQTPNQNEMNYLSKQNQFLYNSISTHYAVLNSANANINFNLGLSRVLSAFCNIIRSSDLNSYSNGMKTTGIKEENKDTGEANAYITEVEWLKGGMLYPNSYKVERKTNVENPYYEPQLVRSFMDSIGNNINSSWSKSVLNVENYNADLNSNTVDYPNTVGETFGLGIVYDGLSNEGVNFAQEQLGLNIKSTLSADVPSSVYVFIKSSQRIMWGGGGLQVSK